ncbi:uncharacterized protein BXZ73DRAFT_98557 [Epithele typhae]|uniref:uncharacterized protein n=1 Tax=Epithele typhae TaxID=378194 RepID=UPI002007795D|nr:uncharacterized protein BXZ73DRAFT_98557 [Epithele typhae]KAH9940728.1 hypothetical protein BXZ73DRAFT_98557 [Epithele typhae]
MSLGAHQALSCSQKGVDGYLARRFKMQSVLGTILDPAADKILMTTLPPVAVIILGRDVLLSLAAFYIATRLCLLLYVSLSLQDFVTSPPDYDKQGRLSCVNTALQLFLMGTATVSPILPMDIGVPLQALQYVSTLFEEGTQC